MAPMIQTKNLDLFYGRFQALKEVNASILERKIRSIIGPSCFGK